ncbi:MAG: hypothetical protein M1830_008955 [Pleopsidium flavum]|nr:MAG: hypothetical protein M1830_008955 [Pleopsidium flavum]
MDSSPFVASIIQRLLMARPDWAYLQFWIVTDIMNEQTRFITREPTASINALLNTVPMNQPPRSFGYINGQEVPWAYQEVLPAPAKRANFVYGLPHRKLLFGPHPSSSAPGELSPTQSYSSFDSNSVVYEALPNLPTPPPQFKESLKAEGPGIGGRGDREPLDREMEAPANLLVNLVPVTAYIQAPCTETIEAFLTRAYDVPLFIISVAACILHSLSPEAFAKAWRAACPLTVTFPTDGKGPFGSYSRDGKTLYTHNLPLKDTWVSPEVIILAALSLADIFSPYDKDRMDKWWVFQVAHGRYTEAQFNATKRCILLDLDHDLMPLTDRAMNRRMVREMAKWQHTLKNRVVERVMREVGTWTSPPPRRSPRLPAQGSNYQMPAVSPVGWSSSPSSAPSSGLTAASLQGQQAVLRRSREEEVTRRR